MVKYIQILSTKCVQLVDWARINLCMNLGSTQRRMPSLTRLCTNLIQYPVKPQVLHNQKTGFLTRYSWGLYSVSTTPTITTIYTFNKRQETRN